MLPDGPTPSTSMPRSVQTLSADPSLKSFQLRAVSKSFDYSFILPPPSFCEMILARLWKGAKGARAHLQAEELDTLTHRIIAWAFTRQSVAWASHGTPRGPRSSR